MSVATGRTARVPVMGGWLGTLTSTDHKRMGLTLGVCSLFFFLLGGVFALLMRTQLAQSNMHFVSDNSYNELFTMHGSTMIYLFVTPMAIAMALYLVPLQIGATRVSAPRLCLAGLWTWICGGLVMQQGWFASGGAGRAGWSSYAPQSNGINTPGVGMDLWVIGVILAAAGMLVMGGCVVATIARRRAAGMSVLRMPVFTWTALVSMLMVVAAFPMLVLVMILLYIDRHGGHIFAGFAGAIDYQDLFWFFGHPVVYVMFFPYLGAAAEAIAVSAHKRWFGYVAFVASMMMFAALSMAVWSHHMYVTGGVTNQYFAFTSTLLLVPAGIEYFDMIGTLIGGSIVLRTSMLFGLTFFIQFLIGGFSGIFVASPVLDYHAYGTYIVVAHFHYTLFAGSIFGFFAGVYHWFPKVTGALLREGLGKLQLALMAVGTNLTFFPMFFLGNDGMPRRVSRYPTHPGWGTLNMLETIGAGIIALGVLVFVINVWTSLRRRVPAGNDPWLGHTLEWATTSPPPPLNFEAPLPPIRSYAPLLDLREEAIDRARERAEVTAGG
ncbi:MAG: cbb3-type cytochrome c oxidase subunit I [Solirubrobacterales bacterium]|nr:cbb3-type cytochrome c oxidase subunit I [Solirubrobacterales bacterium]MBV9363544.1 cbb3-type cytochrome c oxidase subunit I [Solirubrobacterales bacterium]MBV9806445.1 cbb3-type cytochrome c oxidase subunit I [Solirubrobacterales bacterium]